MSSKLNIQWGYNNVCIKKGNEPKAVFITLLRLFEPTVMFFGNLPGYNEYNIPRSHPHSKNHSIHRQHLYLSKNHSKTCLSHETGPPNPTQQQSLPQTRKMLILQEKTQLSQAHYL